MNSIIQLFDFISNANYFSVCLIIAIKDKEQLKRALRSTIEYKVTPNDIATNDRGGIWADKSYKCVPNRWHRLGNFKNKEAKVNILTAQALKKKSLPAPNHYIKQSNWVAESAKNKDNKQRFLKELRITETDKILARRKLKEPGPQTYQPKDGYKADFLPMSKNTP